MLILDDEATKAAASEIAALLRDVGWGRASWQDVCDAMAAAVPGTVPTIVNYHPSNTSTKAMFMRGMDPAALASYGEYYVSINPWLDFWRTVPSGVVKLSEHDAPSSALAGTEFYDDWLLPQRDMTAATGISFDVDAENAVRVAWHYDASRAHLVERATAAILADVAQPFEEAVRTAAAIGNTLQNDVSFGRLLDAIDGAALLFDDEGRVREANGTAARLFEEGDVVAIADGALTLRDAQAHLWLERSTRQLLGQTGVYEPRHVVRGGERIYSLSVSRGPDYAQSSMALLVQPRPLLLLVARLLFGGRFEIDADAMRLAYGLSQAELRLCQILLDGHSLTEAAARLSLSQGTVRQRVKVIFQKTGTHRQGELVALLSRFRRPAD